MRGSVARLAGALFAASTAVTATSQSGCVSGVPNGTAVSLSTTAPATRPTTGPTTNPSEEQIIQNGFVIKERDRGFVLRVETEQGVMEFWPDEKIAIPGLLDIPVSVQGFIDEIWVHDGAFNIYSGFFDSSVAIRETELRKLWKPIEPGIDGRQLVNVTYTGTFNGLGKSLAEQFDVAESGTRGVHFKSCPAGTYKPEPGLLQKIFGKKQ